MSTDNPSIEDLMPKQSDLDASSSKATASFLSQQVKSEAKDEEENAQEKLEEKMTEVKNQSLEEIVQAKALVLGLGYVDFEKTIIDREALPILEKNEMEKLGCVFFLNQSGQVRMGCVDPSEDAKQKLEEVAQENHAVSGLYLISEKSFKKALKEYDNIPKKPVIKKKVTITAGDLEKYKNEVKNLSELPNKIKEIPLTDVVTIILSSAIETGSSDIHIEAEESGIKLRLRVDGVLKNVCELGVDMWKQLISRVKLLSGLKLNIDDKPQDGRISIDLPDDKLDIRVSTLPTSYGESVVMRILRSSSVGLGFEDLGIRGKAFNDLKREVERPNGMILTTGPTGSGKTTTLYAVLNKLNNESAKIITLEDPIEYKLQGINQSQIDKSGDYDFAKGLRSILRQDPDVVMVGEIRDLETADVAINAALTGHLVLSTLHTNDAAGAIPRFLSMGVKPFLLAPAINAVVGQRLVRRLCENCRQETELAGDVLARVMKIIEAIPQNSGYSPDLANIKFYKPIGCDKCSGGYKGRIGIYEIFVMTDEIEKMVLEQKVSEGDVKRITQEAGMISMVQDGILKCLDGITSPEEVFRVAE